MTRLTIAVGLTLVLFTVFMLGVFAQDPALIMPVFCLWTPVAWFTGAAFARAGVGLRSPIQVEAQPPISGRPRARKLTPTEFS